MVLNKLVQFLEPNICLFWNTVRSRCAHHTPPLKCPYPTNLPVFRGLQSNPTQCFLRREIQLLQCFEARGRRSALSSEFHDWSHLSDLALSDVLLRLVPCLPSLSALAATCRPWRRFLLASVSTLLPCIPLLLLQPVPNSNSFHVIAFSPLVITKPIASLLAAFPSILLVRPGGLLLLVDALTGVECLALPLRSAHFPYRYRYATLTPTHLLFGSKYAIVFLPFPPPNPTPEWTSHRLPP